MHPARSRNTHSDAMFVANLLSVATNLLHSGYMATASLSNAEDIHGGKVRLVMYTFIPLMRHEMNT